MKLINKRAPHTYVGNNPDDIKNLSDKDLLKAFDQVSLQVISWIMVTNGRLHLTHMQENAYDLSSELKAEIFRRLENGTWRQQSQTQVA